MFERSFHHSSWWRLLAGDPVRAAGGAADVAMLSVHDQSLPRHQPTLPSRCYALEVSGRTRWHLAFIFHGTTWHLSDEKCCWWRRTDATAHHHYHRILSTVFHSVLSAATTDAATFQKLGLSIPSLAVPHLFLSRGPTPWSQLGDRGSAEPGCHTVSVHSEVKIGFWWVVTARHKWTVTKQLECRCREFLKAINDLNALAVLCSV